MLLPAKVQDSRLIAIVFTIAFVLVASWSLLFHDSWMRVNRSSKQVFVRPKQSGSHILSSFTDFLQTPVNLTDCTKRLGASFLHSASTTSFNYCSDNSSSQLTCLHTDSLPRRRDPFCLGTRALFNNTTKRFDLGGTTKVLNEEQTSGVLPELTQFPSYWYETGPRLILDKHVEFDPSTRVASTGLSLPKDYAILVRREAPIDNLFHHFMQLFSIFMTLDVLQLASDPQTGNPLFRTEDIENTRVVVLDQHEEGPFYEQWTVFAKQPVVRVGAIHSDLTPTPVNIIIPLAGSANPLWQDDWEPKECGNPNLLQFFSQRMLSFYNITDQPQARQKRLVLTFIDRREKRSLIDKASYITELKTSHPDIEINLVDFASLPFAAQLETVQRTDILAGVHGAGLTHSIFLPPSSAVVEILPHGFEHKGFRNLARIMGHRYFTTHGTQDVNHPASRGWQFDDVFIEQERFNSLMDTAIKSIRQGSKEE